MAKRHRPRPKTPAPPRPATLPVEPDCLRRTHKGRARTRASGLKPILDAQQDDRLLREQLSRMGLYATNTIGDGNCLFRALSDQFYGSPSHHFSIRTQVVDYLAQHQDRYQDFVDTDEDQSFQIHLNNMSQLGTYAGHLELNGFANLVQRPVKVIQPGMVYIIGFDLNPPSSSNMPCKSKAPRSDVPKPSSSTPLYIAYHQWEHYSSVRNIDGPHTGLPQIREVSSCVSDGKPNGESSSSHDRQINPKSISKKTKSSSDSARPDQYRDCPSGSSQDSLSPSSPPSSLSSSSSSPPSSSSGSVPSSSLPMSNDEQPNPSSSSSIVSPKPCHTDLKGSGLDSNQIGLSKRQIRLKNRKKSTVRPTQRKLLLKTSSSSSSLDPNISNQLNSNSNVKPWRQTGIETVGLLKELKV